MKYKRIVAVGMSLLVGTMFLAGCTESKQDVIDKQVKELGDLQKKLDNADVEKALLNGEFEDLKLVLTDKDKVLLAFEKEVADLMDLEVVSKEAIDDLELGADVPKQSLDQYDLSFLKSGEVEFDGENYDYEEKIYLDGLKVGTSTSDDVEFDSAPKLLFSKTGAVEFAFEFKDEFEYVDVSEDKPLKLNFLDKSLSIVKVTEDSFTYKVAEEVSLNEGESKLVDGHTVVLEGVFDGKVRVSVDGEVKSVSDGDTKDFGDVQVRVKDVLFKGYQSEFAGADLEIGNDILKTVKDGDEFVEDDEKFVWAVSADSELLSSIGLSYDVKADDLDEEILAAGDSLDFLGYFNLKFDLEKQYEYSDYELSFDDIKDEDLPVLKISTKDDRGLKVDSERLSKVYFDGEKAYWKEDGEWKESNGSIYLLNGDTELKVSYDADEDLLSVGEDIQLKTEDFKSLQEEDKAEESDVYVYGTPSGKVDESLLLDNGVLVRSVEKNADNDKVELSLPDEKVEAVLMLSS